MDYKRARNFFKPLVNGLWRVKVIDIDKFFEGRAVYICNHLSIMDVNVMCTRLFDDPINFVAKDDSIKGKIGNFLSWMGAIPIKRGEPDVKAVKACLKVLKDNKPLIIFPEGTRNIGYPKELLPFKDGAAVFALKTKSPVVPLLYYRKPTIAHKNYIIVGDPVDLSEFYGLPLHESRSRATAKLEKAMDDVRARLDSIVEDKCAFKAYRKENKPKVKQYKIGLKQRQKDYRKGIKALPQG